MADSQPSSVVNSAADGNSADFKDPLGVKDPLSSALDEESDEYDFEVWPIF